MVLEPKYDEIGYWSEIKLDIIKEYAAAYSRILSSQESPNFYHIYVDAFAGAGVHISKRTGEFFPGSPFNALAEAFRNRLMKVAGFKNVPRPIAMRNTAAKIKFISFEPLLDRISNPDLRGINWVIVGGESGPKARPMSSLWVEEIRDLCVKAEIPFFFKQWGGFNKKKNGRTIDGRTWDEMPLSSN
jgi:hypothetical protein